MSDVDRKQNIEAILFDIRYPEKYRPPTKTTLTQKTRSIFHSGELSVLSELLDNDSLSEEDVVSPIALASLVRLGLVRKTKRVAQTPASGTLTLTRFELTDDGHLLALYAHPRTD